MSRPVTRKRSDLERQVLRLLCHPKTDPTSRYGISLALESVHFHEPSNRVVYEEIRALGAIPWNRLRELLPARVNNRGVPDFDFDRLFASENVALTDPQEIALAIRALRNSD